MSKLRRTVVASILAAGALTVGGVGVSNALAANAHSGASQQHSSSGSSSSTHHCPNDGSGSSGSSGSSSTTSISV